MPSAPHSCVLSHRRRSHAMRPNTLLSGDRTRVATPRQTGASLATLSLLRRLLRVFGPRPRHEMPCRCRAPSHLAPFTPGRSGTPWTPTRSRSRTTMRTVPVYLLALTMTNQRGVVVCSDPTLRPTLTILPGAVRLRIVQVESRRNACSVPTARARPGALLVPENFPPSPFY